MKRIGIAVFVLFLVVADRANGQSNNDAAPAERLAALKKEHADAEASFEKMIDALPDTPEGAKKYEELNRVFSKRQTERIMAALDLAKADPKSDVGLAALDWLLTKPFAVRRPAGKSAIELVTKHHAASAKVGKIVAWVGRSFRHESAVSDAIALALMNAVLETNPDRTVRGQAALALAWQALTKFEIAEQKKTPDVDKLAAVADKALTTVVKEFGDCPRLMEDGKRTLGESAKQDLFALRHLRIGKIAPEIDGQDLDGKQLKLSNYRGKVTVIVFWATWCGPCMAMVPHERNLAARLKEKPFALVGVNGDDDRAKAKQTTAKENMAWPSFWSGPEGPHGGICQAWNISHWPAVYVLDARGVIRFRDLHGKELDNAVAALLAEMNQRPASQR